MVLACILGVFAGGLYYQVGVTIAGFQNRVGSLFFLGSLIAFSSLRYVLSFIFMYRKWQRQGEREEAKGLIGSALYNLVEVRGLFLRERAGNFYSYVHISDTGMDEAEADDRSQSWLLSRVLFDIIPLRLIPTILVG